MRISKVISMVTGNSTYDLYPYFCRVLRTVIIATHEPLSGGSGLLGALYNNLFCVRNMLLRDRLDPLLCTLGEASPCL